MVRAWGALLHQAASAGHLVGPRARGGSASPGLSPRGREGPSRPGRAPGAQAEHRPAGLLSWGETEEAGCTQTTTQGRRVRDRPRPGHLHAPEMAWTATRRKPFTSPFSLTTATRCTSGTGYSRLLRYTKALGRGEARSGPPAGHRARRRQRRQDGLTTQHCKAEGSGQPGGGSQGGGKSGQGSGAGGRRGEGRSEQRTGRRRAQPASRTTTGDHLTDL